MATKGFSIGLLSSEPWKYALGHCPAYHFLLCTHTSINSIMPSPPSFPRFLSVLLTFIDSFIVVHISDCVTCMIEQNHDTQMLQMT